MKQLSKAGLLRRKMAASDQHEFEAELLSSNIRVARVILPIIMLFEIYNMLRAAFFSRLGLESWVNQAYFALYVALFLISLVALCFAVQKKEKLCCNAGFYMSVGTVFVVLYDLWGVAITLMDFRKNDNIATYIIVVLSTAVFMYMRPTWSALAMLIIHLGMLIAIPFVATAETGNYFGSMLNMTYMLLIAIVMVFTRYLNALAAYQDRLTIMRQNARIKKINEELSQLVITDSLSGLYNRRFLEDILPMKWSDSIKMDRSVAVLMLDIDDFKQYNDLYGHVAGDGCIEAISQVLVQHTEADDYCIRYGGEEFVVLCFGKSRKEIAQMAETIREQVVGLGLEHKNARYGDLVTVSIGAFLGYPTSESRLNDYIEKADAALYEAKRAGKNRVIFS